MSATAGIEYSAPRDRTEFDTVCRACFNRDNLTPIGSVRLATGTPQFSEMFDCCLQLKLEPDDGLPQKICADCLDELLHFTRFRELCRTNDSILRQIAVLSEPPDHAINCDVIILSDEEPSSSGHHQMPLDDEDDESDEDEDDDTKYQQHMSPMLQPPPLNWLSSTPKLRQPSNSHMSHDTQTVRNLYDQSPRQRQPSQMAGQRSPRQASMIRVRPLNAMVESSAVECSVCNRSFPTTNSLKIHMHIHTNNTPLKCPLCGREFRYQAPFSRHVQKHQSDNLYKCLQCDETFLHKMDLIEHQRNHTFCGNQMDGRSGGEFNMMAAAAAAANAAQNAAVAAAAHMYLGDPNDGNGVPPQSPSPLACHFLDQMLH